MKKGWKKLLAIFLAFVLVICLAPNSIPEVKATETTTTFTYNRFGAQDNLTRYLFYFDVSEAAGAELTNRFWNGTTVYINGQAVTNGINFTSLEKNNLTLVLNYSVLNSAATTASEVGTFTLYIPEGTMLGGTTGNLTTTNALAFKVSGYSITQLQVGEFSCAASAAQDNNKRYYFALAVGGATVSQDIYWNGNTVFVDDVETAAYFALDATNNRLGLCLPYTNIESGVTSYSGFASDHVLEVREHSIIGDIYVAKTIAFHLSKSTIEIKVPQEVVTLTDRPTSGATNGNGFYFVVDPADSFPSDLSWNTNTSFASGGVYDKDGNLIEGVFLKKLLENLYYVCLNDGAGVTASAYDVFTVNGTIKNSDVEVVFTEQSFVFTGSEWNVYTGENYFSITSGVYTYQDWSNLNRWAMTFTTSSALDTPSSLTYLGSYPVLIDEVSTSVSFYNTTTGGLQLFIGQSVLPQTPELGTRVTIPAQTIGENYTLVEDYHLIYNDGWKVCSAYLDASLSVHSGWGSQNLQATLYPNETEVTNASLTLEHASYFVPFGTDAGVWYNGEKLSASPGIKTTVSTDGGYVRYHVLLSDYGITVNSQDIITIRGRFYNEGVYLNFAEIHLKYNGTNWSACSYGYEDLTMVYLDDMLTFDAQSVESSSLYRWLFRIKPSITLETMTSGTNTDYVGYNDQLNIKIYHEDTPETVTTTTTYALHTQYDGNNGNFGMVINFTELPEDADGYIVEIEPGIFRSTNYVYKLAETFRMRNANGKWEVLRERPVATGVAGDANGDGVVTCKDIVRVKREIAQLAGRGGKPLCTEDAFLNERTSIIQDEDRLSICEIILRGDMTGDVPIYVEDDKIMLAAYEGPRAGGYNNYSWDGSNLTETLVETSYLTAEEFQRYADAGLNTLIPQADCNFNSRALYETGTGYWDNITEYMEMAQEADLDVIMYSNILNDYLRGNGTTTCNGVTVDSTVENVAIEIDELWEGITFGGITYKGMKDYDNFAGMMMSDELDYSQVGVYQEAINCFKGISEDIGYFNSQFSMTTDGSHLGGSSLDLSVSARRENFLNAATAFGTVAGSYVYDMYPLRTNSSGTSHFTDEYWLYNLQLSAQNGLDNSYETGITVQSVAQSRNRLSPKYFRSPGAREDIGFQVYTALAYGMKSVTYYTYWEHHSQYNTTSLFEVYTDAMVFYPEEDGGEPVETDIYRAVQTVNNEINKFDHVFMEYDWEGTIPIKVNDSANLFSNTETYGGNWELTEYTYVDGGIYDYSATNDALIGCMYDVNQGFDGFWLVNATVPEEDLSSTVTTFFRDKTEEDTIVAPERLMIYDPTQEGFDGSATIIDYDSTNGYSVELGSGEGVFVIPLY